MKGLVYVDNVPSFYFPLSPTITVGQIRKTINDYLLTKNLSPTQYQIKMYINKSTELPVFGNYQYDNMDLSSVYDQMVNPIIMANNTIYGLERLPKDIVRKISLDLSPRDTLSLCLSNKFFQITVCNNNDFWRNKIVIDYPNQTYPKSYYENKPKNLYMVLSMNSKIIELDANDYPELAANYKSEYSDDDYDEQLIANQITEALKVRPVKEFLKRGDVIHLGWGSNYRNNDKFLWDGKKVILLDYEMDDYGGVPKEFTFPEFRPDYFSESIDHNNIIRFSENKREEIIRNFNPETQKSYVTDKYNKYDINLANTVDDVKVKFNRIYLNENSFFERDEEGDNGEGGIYFYVPVDHGGGGGHMKDGYSHFHNNVTFKPEWKEAIISIEPSQPTTTYKWEGNKLMIEGKEKW